MWQKMLQVGSGGESTSCEVVLKDVRVISRNGSATVSGCTQQKYIWATCNQYTSAGGTRGRGKSFLIDGDTVTVLSEPDTNVTVANSPTRNGENIVLNNSNGAASNWSVLFEIIE